ncbi:endonuclease/exonuclease/phosphatase family protein [Halochromatium sp.]
MSRLFTALLLGALSLSGAAGYACSAPVTLMTWNTEGAELTPAAFAKRIKQSLDAVGPIDLLVLQEVIAKDQVQAAAEAGGFRHWAMSDFSPPVEITGAWHQSLEIAVLSRLPIESVSEWDITGRRPEGDGHPPTVSTVSIPTHERRIDIKIQEPRPARGFLRVDLLNGLTLYGVHWKSSRGADCTAKAREQARRREIQAAGLAADAVTALAEGRTIVVAGDYNIQAPGRVLQVGTDPEVDCAPTRGRCDPLCGPDGRDGYDDSIALLLGLDDCARLLSGTLDSTYVLRRFPGGAIDHILVAGPRAGAFSAATTPPVSGPRWQGSDHRPVLVRLPDAQ